jgi:hypothetical protein
MITETEQERNEEDFFAIFQSVLNRCCEKIMVGEEMPSPALIGFTDKIVREAINEYLKEHPKDFMGVVA